MVLVISTVVYSLLLLRRDAAHSSLAIHNCSLLSSGIKYGKKKAQLNVPQPLLPK